MSKVVGYISLIIWIIYFCLLLSREIIRKNKNKEKYTWSLLKHDIFYLFRLDSLFFLIMFYIYKGFNNQSVTNYLYFVFVFSSLVFILYDIDEKYDLKKISFKKEKLYYLVGFILLLIPFIYYFVIKKSLANTFLITLIINFLIPIIIYLLKVIFKYKMR